MKKFFLSVLCVMTAITMSAITYTDQVSITLDDGTYMPNLVVGESNELADGEITNGYASEIQDLSTMPLAVYAIFNNVKYSMLAMKHMTNIPIGIKTSGQTSYTMYFDDLTGVVRIYDKKTEAEIPITEGGEYSFTIEPSEKNSELNNRFVLFYERAADEGELELCFQYGILTIVNNPYLTNIVVKDENGVTKVDAESTNTPQEIDLSKLPDGAYTVELNEGAEVLHIRKF